MEDRTSATPGLRVLIVAQDPLARAGLATLLAGRPGLGIAGQVAEDSDLKAALEVFRPDVVVWDLGWEPATALERLGDLGELDTPVVALLPDETSAGEAWASGVRGLLLRSASATALGAAVEAAAQGIVALEPELASALLAVRERTPAAPNADLTPREIEVLRLLAEGLSNKAIAHRLDISEHTVKFHVNSILGKLGAQSRTEAVMRATRMGLVLL